MRRMVARLRGTDDTSTRSLTTEQLAQLVDQVEDAAPRKRRRARPGGGKVRYLVSRGELRYIDYLAQQLGWDGETLAKFSRRQCKRDRPTTHRAASSVIEPLERMLRERGWQDDGDRHGRKWWTPPQQEP